MAFQHERNPTVEQIFARRLWLLARDMDARAEDLKELATEEARQHAKELQGAAKMVRQWERTLREKKKDARRAREAT